MNYIWHKVQINSTKCQFVIATNVLISSLQWFISILTDFILSHANILTLFEYFPAFCSKCQWRLESSEMKESIGARWFNQICHINILYSISYLFTLAEVIVFSLTDIKLIESIIIGKCFTYLRFSSGK